MGCMIKTSHDPETPRQEVRRRYGSIATGDATPTPDKNAADACCEPGDAKRAGAASGCCGAAAQARTLGYSETDLVGIPDGANLGLGCGNPVALASLKPGQTVLDLGAGAGFDAFIAARTVGATGRVIGVDMTPEVDVFPIVEAGPFESAVVHPETSCSDDMERSKGRSTETRNVSGIWRDLWLY